MRAIATGALQRLLDERFLDVRQTHTGFGKAKLDILQRDLIGTSKLKR